jgi:hypothetical protein
MILRARVVLPIAGPAISDGAVVVSGKRIKAVGRWRELDGHKPDQLLDLGDVVLMPQGYHPNVAAPGGSINFLWMMAANREREDRKYGVFNVQPEFAAK